MVKKWPKTGQQLTKYCENIDTKVANNWPNWPYRLVSTPPPTKNSWNRPLTKTHQGTIIDRHLSVLATHRGTMNIFQLA